MPRKSLNLEGSIGGGQCKIRKRGCSSSSSSSVVKNYRLKRAVLVGKRGGSSTPAPNWKMGSRVRASGGFPEAKPTRHLSLDGGDKGDEFSVSARKLGATLWEINEVVASPRGEVILEGNLGNKVKGRERIVKSPMPMHLSDPSHSPDSERMQRSKASRHQRRKSAISEKFQLAECNVGGFESLQNASLVEIETQSRGLHNVRAKSRLKDVMNSLTTSKELLKVFSCISGLEAQHTSTISIITALQLEIDRARGQVHQLIKEQRTNGCEIDYLLHQFAEEKAAWKRKEQDKVRSAVAFVAGELKVEKKLRRQTERLNKKLGRELADSKALLLKAGKELESEKRAKEILEQVCDELARGIGEDRAEVEELKRESAKVWEEVEKEREMLQLADVLREERVQMKLSEAKYQFEEKNAAVEKLKNQLETYLGTKVSEDNNNGRPEIDKIKELEEYLRKTLNGSWQNRNKENGKDEGEVMNSEEDEEDDDSADSDLHSIELNMDNNSKSYNWSFASEVVACQDDPKRKSVDGKIKARKSISGKTKRKNSSSDRRSTDGIMWDFSTNNQENSGGVASQAWKKDCEDEIERYEMVKDLRDYILSGSKIVSSQGFASPTRQWGHQSLPPSHDPCGVVSGSSIALK